MRLTTKGRFAVTAMIDLALRQGTGPVTLAAISQRRFDILTALGLPVVPDVNMSHAMSDA